MKVLWITMVPMRVVCEALGRKRAGSGGWVDAMFATLLASAEVRGGDVTPGVLCAAPVSKLTSREIAGVQFYLFPARWGSRCSREVQDAFATVNASFRPDAVHVHGSEYTHGLNWILANGSSNVMVSIQGLISVIERYYLSGLGGYSGYTTLRDILRRDSLARQKEKFRLRGVNEKRLLSAVPYAAGRTAWDYAQVKALNPAIRYFKVGEPLREEFRGTAHWDYSGCRPHSIFISAGSYPVKGLHVALEAMALVSREYPDVRMVVAGENPVDRPMWRLAGYGKLLRGIIRRHGLGERVEFVGMQDASQMVGRYLRANLFLLPSAVENSPNSLAEAMSLGVPCVASYCGGVPEMVEDPDSLYRFEEPEMLARKICRIFATKAAAAPVPRRLPHNEPEEVLHALLEAYARIAAEDAGVAPQ